MYNSHTKKLNSYLIGRRSDSIYIYLRSTCNFEKGGNKRQAAGMPGLLVEAPCDLLIHYVMS